MKSRFLCVNDRITWVTVKLGFITFGYRWCPICGHEGLQVHEQWRPPSVTDRDSWREIEGGNLRWHY